METDLKGKKRKNKLGILLKIEFRSLWDRIMNMGNRGKAMSIFIVVILIYSIGVMSFLMAKTFGTLSLMCTIGLGWLYFALVGTMIIALSLFSTTMMAESMIFSAKDNDILLPMPITPSAIFTSRMSLIAIINGVMTVYVMAFAAVMAAPNITYKFTSIIGIIVGILGITVISQALVCLLAWVLHLLLAKLSPAIAAFIFMAAFFLAYFKAIGSGNQWLTSLATGGSNIDQTVKSFAWPIYAMGMGCVGDTKHLMLFALCSLVVLLVTWTIMSRTFLKLITLSGGDVAGGKERKKRKIQKDRDGNQKGIAGAYRTQNVRTAIAVKEFRHFVSSSVYLTNMGIGILLMVMAAVGSLVARDKLIGLLSSSGLPTNMLPLVLYYLVGFLVATNVVTAPNISLEGNNLWILKSTPVSAKNILMGKLKFHLILMIPVSIVCIVTIGLSLGCTFVETAVIIVNAVAYIFLCGTFGLLINLKYPRFDWATEVVPCKQSASTIVTMLSMYGILIFSFVSYYFLLNQLDFARAYGIIGLVLIVGCMIAGRALLKKGTYMWDAIDA